MKGIILTLCFLAVTASAKQIFNTKTSGSSRIVGGGDVSISEYPWYVGMHIFTEYTRSRCGGSLIHENYIITVAHCLYFPHEKVELHFGSDRWNSEPPSMRLLHSFKIHENYNNESLDNDIAVAYFKDPIIVTENIQIVALPRLGDIVQAGEQNLFICGSGYTDDGWRDELKASQVTSLNEETCTRFKFNDEAQICVIGAKTDTACIGDSGGSMVIRDENGIFLHGLVSYVTPRCAWGKPFVLTRVEHYLYWILDTMNNLN